MHAKQAKTHNSKPAAKATEPTPKVTHNAAASTRLPTWTNAWGDHPPAGLFPHEAGNVSGLQAKLAISQPDDPYEQEADRVADQVMRTPAPGTSMIQEHPSLMRKENGSAGTVQSVPPLVSSVLNSGDGQPLDAGTRGFMESRFGHDFSQVRVHTGAQSTESAHAIQARAFTTGNNIVFADGQYRPTTTMGQKLLAHELTHVVQQTGASNHNTTQAQQGIPVHAKVSEEIIQREYDPENENTWYLFHTEGRRKASPQGYEELLSSATGTGLKLSESIEKNGPPHTSAERDTFENTLEMLIRMTALGMMASHRATILGRRQETLDQIAHPQKSKEGEQHRTSGKETKSSQTQITKVIRATALEIDRLNKVKEKLEEHRNNFVLIDINARHSLLIDEEKIGDWLADIAKNSEEYLSPEIYRYLQERFTRAQNIPAKNIAVLFVAFMAKDLAHWRQIQINGVNTALFHIYEAFPFFAKVDTETFFLDYPTDDKLIEGVRTAYDKLVESIDRAIIKIGKGDINAFDLPAAVESARESLSPELRPHVKRVLEERKLIDFAKTLGVTLLQAAIALLPIVGPVIAVGIGALQVGASLKDMLDRMELSEASASPDRSMLGVNAPSTFAWVMAGVQTALLAADLAGVWSEISSSRLRFEAEPVAPAGSGAPGEKGMPAPSKQGVGTGEPPAGPKVGTVSEPEPTKAPSSETFEEKATPPTEAPEGTEVPSQEIPEETATPSEKPSSSTEKAPKGTEEGDIWRYKRYKEQDGKLSFKEWYKVSRGGRSGGPGHQKIQQKLLEFPNAAKEVPVGNRFADAYWPNGPDGKPVYHQIGGKNLRGDPIFRERGAIEDIRKTVGNKADIYFWDKNYPGAPPLINPDQTPGWFTTGGK